MKLYKPTINFNYFDKKKNMWVTYVTYISFFLFALYHFVLSDATKIPEKLNNEIFNQISKKKIVRLNDLNMDSLSVKFNQIKFINSINDSNGKLISEYSTNTFLKWDNNDSSFFAKIKFVAIIDSQIVVKSFTGYYLFPQQEFRLIVGYDEVSYLFKQLFVFLLVGIILMLLLIYNGRLINKIRSKHNSYQFYKKWSEINYITRPFLIIPTMLGFFFVIIFNHTIQDNKSYSEFLYTVGFLYEPILHFMLIGTIFFGMIRLIDPIIPIYNIVYYFRQNNNIQIPSFEITYNDYLYLREIDDLTRAQENRFEFFLVRIGIPIPYLIYSQKQYNKYLSKNPEAVEILSTLQKLNNYGYIILNNTEIRLTTIAKDKLALPSMLFINNIPSKYEYEIARANVAFLKNNSEEAIKICSTDILESFLKWIIIKIEPDNSKIDTVIKKVLGSNGLLENATLGRLIRIFREITNDYKNSSKDQIDKMNYILDGCYNIIEAAKIIRNDYSHQRDPLEYTTPKVAEDAYNLIHLSRVFISTVCRHFVP